MVDTSKEIVSRTTSSVTEEQTQDVSGLESLNEVPSGGFLDRTLRSAWQAIAGVARGRGADIRPGLPDADVARLKGQILDCLALTGGEVSARARAALQGRKRNAADTGPRTDGLRNLLKFVFFLILFFIFFLHF